MISDILVLIPLPPLYTCKATTSAREAGRHGTGELAPITHTSLARGWARRPPDARHPPGWPQPARSHYWTPSGTTAPSPAAQSRLPPAHPRAAAARLAVPTPPVPPTRSAGRPAPPPPARLEVAPAACHSASTPHSCPPPA